jgi:hypothetical protein
MTRFPIAELENILDTAAQMHPHSRTLGDYRSPSEIRLAEQEALGAARFLITPHSQIAAIDPGRSIKLNWQLPKSNNLSRGGGAIVFPASTLARKGCYEMREVARDLGLELQLAGPVIEAPDFWGSIATVSPPASWMDNAALIILPAWIEHWPRRLLRAAAAGISVIASFGCGLGGVPNVTEIAVSDRCGLESAVRRKLPAIRA